MKAGAAYVPLDPTYPRERIAAVLADASPSLLLTQHGLAETAATSLARVVKVDAAWHEICREPTTAPPCDATPEDLAYIIYTSGSTGKPKGVAIPHRAVVNLLCSMARRPGLSADDTLYAVTTLSFDIAVLELYLPLIVGARVVIAPRDVSGDGHKLLAALRSTRTTVMQATPATWRLLLEAGWMGEPDLKILCGGEALPRNLADALLARSRSVWNMYGPTETTVWSATAPVNPGPDPVTIGPPIANTEFYVLDFRGQPVPIGIPGELHIGGHGIARGYWNRPDLTAEKFLPDPFRTGLDRRLYKTGDLVRYRPDGSLEFLGRLDNQVKVRGFRIETGEVETALMLYPGMRECVVVAREDGPGERRLVAYIVAAKPSPAAGELRTFLAKQLPIYMVPAVYAPVDSLPRTPNGKVDRRALPAPLATEPAADTNPVEPRNGREKLLADICEEVLRLKRVGVRDSLFDLGADSLQVFQIVARANDHGLMVTPAQVLSERTIADICASLDRSKPAGARAPISQIVPVARDRYRKQRFQVNRSDELN
jgi:amino acid adenylation domain-containing protein